MVWRRGCCCCWITPEPAPVHASDGPRDPNRPPGTISTGYSVNSSSSTTTTIDYGTGVLSQVGFAFQQVFLERWCFLWAALLDNREVRSSPFFNKQTRNFIIKFKTYNNIFFSIKCPQN